MSEGYTPVTEEEKAEIKKMMSTLKIGEGIFRGKEGLTIFQRDKPEESKVPFPKPVQVKDSFDFHMRKTNLLLGVMRKQVELMVTAKRTYDRANTEEVKEVIRETFKQSLEAFSKFYVELGDLLKGLTG